MCIRDRSIEIYMYIHVMVKSMNFGGGGGAISLQYYALKQNFSLQEKRVGGVTVKKITSSKTCHVHGV